MQVGLAKNTSAMAACKRNPVVLLERINTSAHLSSVSAVNVKQEYISDLVPRVKTEIDASSEESEVDDAFSSLSPCRHNESLNAVTEDVAAEQVATLPPYSVLNDQNCSEEEQKVFVKTEMGQEPEKFLSLCPRISSQQCGAIKVDEPVAEIKREPELEGDVNEEHDNNVTPPTLVSSETLNESQNKCSVPSNVYYDRDSIKLKDVRVILVDLFANLFNAKLKKGRKTRAGRKSSSRHKQQLDSENSTSSFSKLSDNCANIRLTKRATCQATNGGGCLFQNQAESFSSVNKCISDSQVPVSFNLTENTSENQAVISLGSDEGDSEISTGPIKFFEDSGSRKIKERALKNGAGTEFNMNKCSLENGTEIRSDVSDGSFEKRARLCSKVDECSLKSKSGKSLNVNECMFERLETASLNIDNCNLEDRAGISSNMKVSTSEDRVRNSSNSECMSERLERCSPNLNDHSFENRARISSNMMKFSSKSPVGSSTNGREHMFEHLGTPSLNMNEYNLETRARISSKMKDSTSEDQVRNSSSSECMSERLERCSPNLNDHSFENRARISSNMKKFSSKSPVGSSANSREHMFEHLETPSLNMNEHNSENRVRISSKMKEVSLENPAGNSSNSVECTSERFRTFNMNLNECSLEKQARKDGVKNSSNSSQPTSEVRRMTSLNIDEHYLEKRACISSKMKEVSLENPAGNSSNGVECTSERFRTFNMNLNEFSLEKQARKDGVKNSSNSSQPTSEVQRMTSLNIDEHYLEKRACISSKMKESTLKNRAETFCRRNESRLENQAGTILNTNNCSLESRGENSTDQGLCSGYSREGGTESAPYICVVCKKPFYDADTLISHTVSCEDFWHTCLHCSKKTRSTDTLALHMLQEHAEMNPFCCSLCSARFQSNDMLCLHLQTHSSGRPFSCALCQRGFSRLQYLRLHIITHRLLSYACLLCLKRFASRRTMTEHFIRAHSDKELKEFRCKLCPATFKTTSDFNGHLVSHIVGKRLKCPECPQEFQSKESLVVHLMEHLDQESVRPPTFDMQQLINITVDGGFENQSAVDTNMSDSFEKQVGITSEHSMQANDLWVENRAKIGASLDKCSTDKKGEAEVNPKEARLKDRIMVNPTTAGSGLENHVEVRSSTKNQVRTSFEVNEWNMDSEAQISSSIREFSSESREKTSQSLNDGSSDDQIETIWISDEDSFEDDEGISSKRKESGSENQLETIWIRDEGSFGNQQGVNLITKELGLENQSETILTRGGTLGNQQGNLLKVSNFGNRPEANQIRDKRDFQDHLETSLNMKESNLDNQPEAIWMRDQGSNEDQPEATLHSKESSLKSGPETIWIMDEDSFEDQQETVSNLKDCSLESEAAIILEQGSCSEYSDVCSASRPKNSVYSQLSTVNLDEAPQLRFNLESSLTHSANSSGVKPSCVYCRYGLSSWAEANEHVRKHDGKRKTFSYPSSLSHGGIENQQGCAHCSKTFMSKKLLPKQWASVHLSKAPLSGTFSPGTANNEPYPCTSCPRTFSQVEDLKKHSGKCGSPRLDCALCPRKFKSKKTLEQHLKLVHVSEKRFYCDCCPARFTTANGLHQHERSHFSCTFCWRTFSQAEGLMKHMETSCEESRYGCTLCSKMFESKENLQRHAETAHFNKRPLFFDLSEDKFTTIQDQHGYYMSVFKNTLQAPKHDNKTGRLEKTVDLQPLSSQTQERFGNQTIISASNVQNPLGSWDTNKPSAENHSRKGSSVNDCGLENQVVSNLMNKRPFENLGEAGSNLSKSCEIQIGVIWSVTEGENQQETASNSGGGFEDPGVISHTSKSGLDVDECSLVNQVVNSLNRNGCTSENLGKTFSTMTTRGLQSGIGYGSVISECDNQEKSNYSRNKGSLQDPVRISLTLNEDMCGNIIGNSLNVTKCYNQEETSSRVSECSVEDVATISSASYEGSLPTVCPLRTETLTRAHHQTNHIPHSDKKQLTCALCSRTFKRKGDLIKHMELGHSENLFSCNLCSAIFKTVSDVNRHRSVHDGESFITCMLCARAFSGTWYLKRHMQFHSDKRPYSCPVCGTTFKSKRGKQLHLKTKHKNKDFGSGRSGAAEKPAKCPEGQVTFGLQQAPRETGDAQPLISTQTSGLENQETGLNSQLNLRSEAEIRPVMNDCSPSLVLKATELGSENRATFLSKVGASTFEENSSSISESDSKYEVLIFSPTRENGNQGERSSILNEDSSKDQVMITSLLSESRNQGERSSSFNESSSKDRVVISSFMNDSENEGEHSSSFNESSSKDRVMISSLLSESKNQGECSSSFNESSSKDQVVISLFLNDCENQGERSSSLNENSLTDRVFSSALNEGGFNNCARTSLKVNGLSFENQASINTNMNERTSVNQGETGSKLGEGIVEVQAMASSGMNGGILSKVAETSLNQTSCPGYSVPGLNNLPSPTQTRGYDEVLPSCSKHIAPAESHSINSTKEELSCADCPMKFSSWPELTAHVTEHLSKRPDSRTGRRKVFFDANTRKSRLKTHSDVGRYICPLCSEAFELKRTLVLHLKQVHRKENSYRCKLCSARFCTDHSLCRHTRNHTSENFSCTVCAMTFPRFQYLQWHMKRHSLEGLYQCALCSRTFESKLKVAEHLKQIHSNKKPFRCKLCPNRFRTNCNLRSHLKSHSDERPYQCALCPRTFKSKSNVKAHLKRVHCAFTEVS